MASATRKGLMTTPGSASKPSPTSRAADPAHPRLLWPGECVLRHSLPPPVRAPTPHHPASPDPVPHHRAVGLLHVPLRAAPLLSLPPVGGLSCVRLLEGKATPQCGSWNLVPGRQPWESTWPHGWSQAPAGCPGLCGRGAGSSLVLQLPLFPALPSPVPGLESPPPSPPSTLTVNTGSHSNRAQI